MSIDPSSVGLKPYVAEVVGASGFLGMVSSWEVAEKLRLKYGASNEHPIDLD